MVSSEQAITEFEQSAPTRDTTFGNRSFRRCGSPDWRREGRERWQWLEKRLAE
jgi:hypothetical protein